MLLTGLLTPHDFPQFARDGQDWPLRAHSRFEDVGGVTWHLQRLGRGPTLLALHGTGAATHTWRDLAPRLAERFEVVLLDLPGHGFTQLPPPEESSLPGMSRRIGGLLRTLGIRPEVVVGHSAGAAIACRMTLDRWFRPRAVVSVNGALRPFEGLAGRLYPPAARLVTWNPLAAHWVAYQARDPRLVEEIVVGTGSRLDARGLALYRRLARRPGHIAGALAMMAQWELGPLEPALRALDLPLILMAGARDRAVPPAHAHHLAARLPRARVVVTPDAGHLSHEERPETTAEQLLEALEAASSPS